MNGHEKRMFEASLVEYKNMGDNYTKIEHKLRIEGHTAKMGINGTAVYMMLRSHRNNTTGQCNPSMDTIAAELGTSESTVKRAISHLIKEGYIIKISGRANTKRDAKTGQIQSDSNDYIIVPLNYVGKEQQEATMTMTVNVKEEPVKAERKAQQPKEKVTEEELEQAEAEYNFMDIDKRQLMLQAIKQVGYRPGYSNTIMDIWDKGNFDSHTSNYKSYWITGLWD